MAIALGSNVVLAGKFSTGGYGTKPTGNYQKLFFRSGNLGAAQNLINDPVLGQGRFVAQPSQGNVDINNSLQIPVDVRAVGIWLKGAFGAPTTTGTTPNYTHTFSVSSGNLPDLALELGHPDLSPARYSMLLGMMVASIQFQMQASDQLPSATVNLLGQTEENATSSTQAGTPTNYTYTPFTNFQGSIKRNTVALGNITSGGFGVNNNAQGVRVISASATTGGVDIGTPAYDGTLTARFTDGTLADDAQDGTTVALEFAYTIDANTSMVWTYNNVLLPRQPRGISGPGGIEFNFNWQGFDSSTAGDGLSVVLKNDVASY